MRDNQTPFVPVHKRWYGLYLLIPRTNVLKVFIDWVLRVRGGSAFHALVVDGKNELYVEVRREWVGRSGCW